MSKTGMLGLGAAMAAFVSVRRPRTPSKPKRDVVYFTSPEIITKRQRRRMRGRQH